MRLSNTLPLDKRLYQSVMPQLNKLRERISTAKNPKLHVVAPAVSMETGPWAAQELAQLGQLREAGVLTDEEFASAKAAVIARMSSGA
ncbi:SHOCT domain-containing protein [Cellulomonas sp. 179-A 4D5 NHS]|uniref:SHOCT domain-containing protein n=1 Tax=Cellulomonas sp. 179-A 4D5 NHS TaxID=3142378 RepID=UPI0039A0AF11